MFTSTGAEQLGNAGAEDKSRAKLDFIPWFLASDSSSTILGPRKEERSGENQEFVENVSEKRIMGDSVANCVDEKDREW